MRDLVVRYTVVNASIAAIMGLSMPVMYLALLDKGLSLADLGLLVAAFTLSALIFEVPCGALADCIGRKRVFLCGEAVLLVATAGFWLAASPAALAGVMALSGMSRALLSGSLDALFVKQIQAIRGADTYGPSFLAVQARMGFVASFSLGVAAILGGLLPMWFGPRLAFLGWARPYEINYLVMLPLVAVHIALTAHLIEEGDAPRASLGNVLPLSRAATAMSLESVVLAVRAPVMQVLMATQFICGGALEIVETFWQPRLAQLIDGRAGAWVFGVLCALSFLAMALGHLVAGRLAGLFRERYLRLLLVLQPAMGAAMIALAEQRRLVGFVLCYMAIHFVNGAMVAPSLTLFHARAEERLRSTLLSVKALCLQAGACLGALAAAPLAQDYGIASAWALAGGSVLAGTMLFGAPALRRPPASRDAPHGQGLPASTGA